MIVTPGEGAGLAHRIPTRCLMEFETRVVHRWTCRLTSSKRVAGLLTRLKVNGGVSDGAVLIIFLCVPANLGRTGSRCR
jgi:hypothetical protein